MAEVTIPANVNINFREKEVAALIPKIMEMISAEPCAMEVKMAALRATADVLNQSVVAHGAALIMSNALRR